MGVDGSGGDGGLLGGGDEGAGVEGGLIGVGVGGGGGGDVDWIWGCRGLGAAGHACGEVV